MRLYRTPEGAICLADDVVTRLPELEWSSLFRAADPADAFAKEIERGTPVPSDATAGSVASSVLLPPVSDQRICLLDVDQKDQPRLVGHKAVIDITKQFFAKPAIAAASSHAGRIFGFTIALTILPVETSGTVVLSGVRCILGPCLFLSELESPPEVETKVYREGELCLESRVGLARLDETISSARMRPSSGDASSGAFLVAHADRVHTQPMSSGVVFTIGVLPIGTLEVRIT